MLKTTRLVKIADLKEFKKAEIHYEYIYEQISRVNHFVSELL